MKRIAALLILLILSAPAYPQFAGKTKNKPITRMTRAQLKRAHRGVTFYTKYNGRMYKNTRAVQMTKARESIYRKMFRKR